MEQNTWGLLQAIMPSVYIFHSTILMKLALIYLFIFTFFGGIFNSARQTDPPDFLSAKDLLLKNPYTPTSTLAQAVIQASPLLSELIVVREWLQETAPAPSPPEANTGYWKFTKHTVMQSLRTGNPQRDGLVTEMDPDAVNRGDGATLAADDAVS
jgi:nuclear pore complex protein Nup107